MHKAYWWRAIPNFGDVLNTFILDQLGAEHDWASPADADLLMIGSVLEHLPKRWSGQVIGAGKLYEDTQVDLSHADVYALRGKLTRASVTGVDYDVVLGDPALLTPLWVQQPPSKYDLGIIPHWSDTELHKRFSYGHLIDPRQEPGKVASEIAACKRVISSSLHGIILADAFGIPRRAELFPLAGREGGDFKFRDYASIFDGDPHFGEFWTAPRETVLRVRGELRRALHRAGVGRPSAPAVTPPPAVSLPRIACPNRWFKRRPDISILVPFRDDGEHRSRVWTWLRQYWRDNLDSVEIIQGHDWGTPFSKAAAVNDAASRARGRVFVILDADAYMDANALQECVDNILAAQRRGKRLWYMPYTRLHRLNEFITHVLVDDVDASLPYVMPTPVPEIWLERDRESTHYGHQYGAMITVMPREAFFLVGGMDQRFRGWGGEDVSFLRSLDTLYALHEVADNDLCHLWHARPGNDYKTRRWVGQAAFGPANSRLAYRYSHASGEPTFMRGLAEERERPISRPWWR